MAENDNKRPFTKEWFIRELAHRARFTIGDASYLWDAVEDIFKDIIYNEESLVIPGMFRLSVTTIPEHEGYNPFEGEPMIIPESKRVVFRASRRLLDLFKDEEKGE